MNRPRRFALTAAIALGSLVPLLFMGCGGDDGAKPDAGEDGTIIQADGDIDTGSMGGDTGCAPFCNDGGCVTLGSACKSSGDCCSGSCLANGTCGVGSCTSDGVACNVNGDCCSQICTNNICQPLNPNCKTLGNKCGACADCCSKLCYNGTCQPSSYCTQPGDVCANDGDCCTGVCNKPMNQSLGICSADPPKGPSNCGQVDGVTCGGSTLCTDAGFTLGDGGLPACGGSCCSRDCAPYGLTGILICQPASGCHVVGDTCTKDSECCGSANLPNGPTKPVTCEKTGNYPIGVCRNPIGCKPDGDICKLKGSSCNASCDCCVGNCNTKDTCHQDILGVPRCSPACTDAGVEAGSACASSANCCGKPCVPDNDGGYTCTPTNCQSCTQSCSITADCCPGMSCLSGKCGPCSDGGTTDGGPCSQYGQTCTQNSDCCNGVPCSNGHCYYPPN